MQLYTYAHVYMVYMIAMSVSLSVCMSVCMHFNLVYLAFIYL